VLLGQKPVQSLVGGDDKITACRVLYPIEMEALLSSYPWKFAQSKIQLARVTEAPVNEWKYAYTLPSGRIGDPSTYYDSGEVGAVPILEWEVQGNNLLTDAEQIFCDYTFDVSEPRWPAYFVKLASLVMAAALAMPLTRDQSKVDHYRALAYGTPQENGNGGEWLKATNIDAMGQTNIALHPDSFFLVNVRGS
jgi:hypothetical protein